MSTLHEMAFLSTFAKVLDILDKNATFDAFCKGFEIGRKILSIYITSIYIFVILFCLFSSFAFICMCARQSFVALYYAARYAKKMFGCKRPLVICSKYRCFVVLLDMARDRMFCFFKCSFIKAKKTGRSFVFYLWLVYRRGGRVVHRLKIIWCKSLFPKTKKTKKNGKKYE